ncbi:MAG: DUF3883 domain-containing protein [Rudanella sp.]|nr:DUF3883 domain-containing protein [Rudanella sp.]
MKHENYEILNLIGYGMAKFDAAFITEFGFSTKVSFYDYLISLGIAETRGVIKNRQDLFDPYFENSRIGWITGFDRYIHRKEFIDSFLGMENVKDYAEFVKLYLSDKFKVTEVVDIVTKPILVSKYKQIQLTGREAESYFISNFTKIDMFKDGNIEDARLYGDGYDFQVETPQNTFLAEIKGLNDRYGGFRLTENEYNKATEYRDKYCLIMVSNLAQSPKLALFPNPIAHFRLARTEVQSSPQIYYSSDSRHWL